MHTKTRVISGVIGVTIMALVLLLHNTFVYPLAVSAIVCMALYELYCAGGCLHCQISVCAGFVYGVLMPILSYYQNHAAMVGVTFFCMMAIFLELVLRHRSVQYQETLYLVAVTILVTGSLHVMILLLQIGSYGIAYVILALCSAWISDTGAYFTGTFLGKHKLCLEVSPKKTVEGFFGGIVADVVVMLLFAWIYCCITKLHMHCLWLIFVAIVCAVAGVLGDLSASVLKRQLRLKDFGNLIPGHGGIMDRFDSVLFTLPAFYALECLYPIFYA